MNQRLLAVLLIAVLVGAGIYLWLRPPGPPMSEPSPPPTPGTTSKTDSPSAASDAFFILAVSWQPAFCETAPTKPECRAQGEGSFEARHFTLHGLWPQDEYCGVSDRLEDLDRDGRWSELPAPELTNPLRTRLVTAMPGTASHLDRHEWIKHGTCFHGDAETYYAVSLALLDQLNASPVRDLFVDSIGKRLTQSAIRAAFDHAFGADLGQRVRVACADDGDRTLVTELTLGLWGVVDADPDLAHLLAAARPTNGGCGGGVVDAVGLH
jgi:ribonuclease T2